MPPVNQVHRDKVWKFSLKVFNGWQPLPLQPGERQVVCRFRDPDGSGQRVGTLDPAIEVLRVGPGLHADVTTGASAAEPTALADGAVLEAAIARIQARSPQTASPLSFDVRRAKQIRSRDRVHGQLVSTEQDLGTMGRGVSRFLMVATYEKDNAGYALLMSCGARLRRRWESRFRQVAKSFTWKDRKAGNVERLDVLDKVNLTPARRRAIERNLVTGWGVVVSPKKNYVVVYNTKGRRNDALAKEIARRIELIRAQIYEKQFPPANKIDAVSVVRVCGDKAEYHQYGGPGGSAGYWSPGTEELVFYDASPSKKIDDNTLSVLYHEAFHQYIHYSAGSFAPHSWFNEGHGDYYGGAELRGRRYRLKPFQWRVGVIKAASRPRTAHADLQRGPAAHVHGQGLHAPEALPELHPGGVLQLPHRLVRARVESRLVPPGDRAAQPAPREEVGDTSSTPTSRPSRRRLPYATVACQTPAPRRLACPSAARRTRTAASGSHPPPIRDTGPRPLNKALRAAFEGVDIDELEAEWLQHADGR